MADTKTQQESPKPRISRLALVAACLALYAPAALWVAWNRQRPPYESHLVNHILLGTGILAVALSLVLAGLAQRAIIRNRPGLRGVLPASAPFLLAIVSGMLLAAGPHTIVEWRVYNCRANVRQLYMGLNLYAMDNAGRYPVAETWCDLVAPIVNDDGSFKCPCARESRCNFAMNPDCEPNSPGDVVLLFESQPGWNSHGGVELLTFENHHGKAANVVLNDGTVRMIGPEDVDRLIWKP